MYPVRVKLWSKHASSRVGEMPKLARLLPMMATSTVSAGISKSVKLWISVGQIMPCTYLIPLSRTARDRTTLKAKVHASICSPCRVVPLDSFIAAPVVVPVGGQNFPVAWVDPGMRWDRWVDFHRVDVDRFLPVVAGQEERL